MAIIVTEVCGKEILKFVPDYLLSKKELDSAITVTEVCGYPFVEKPLAISGNSIPMPKTIEVCKY